MKKNEIFLVVSLAIIAAVSVFVIANSVFKVDERKAEVEVVDKYSSTINLPEDSLLLSPNRTSIEQDPQLNQQINKNPFAGN